MKRAQRHAKVVPKAKVWMLPEAKALADLKQLPVILRKASNQDKVSYVPCTARQRPDALLEQRGGLDDSIGVGVPMLMPRKFGLIRRQWDAVDDLLVTVRMVLPESPDVLCRRVKI